jgi:hypothetical protein
LAYVRVAVLMRITAALCVVYRMNEPSSSWPVSACVCTVGRPSQMLPARTQLADAAE